MGSASRISNYVLAGVPQLIGMYSKPRGAIVSLLPVVLGITPNTGAQGTLFRITGYNFDGVSSVTIGGVSATGLLIGGGIITGFAPAGSVGAQNVVVTGPAGATTLAGGFTYSSGAAAPTVSSIAPTFGDTAGFTAVTITGTGFTGATGATIGGVSITSLVVVNDSTITGVTGAHAAATGQSVIVTAPGGSNGANSLYEYFNPTSIANLATWHRADLGVTGSTNISSWADQSGNGVTLAQASGPSQPFIFSAPTGFNGRPAIGTNGVDATLGLTSGAISIPQPAWVFMVVSIPVTPSHTIFFRLNTSGSNASAHGVSVSAGMVLVASDSGTLSGPTLTTATTYILAIKFNTGSSAILVNHWSTTSATGALSGDTETAIFQGTFSGNAAQYLLAEEIEFARNLSAGEVQKIVQYLGARYNVSVSA